MKKDNKGAGKTPFYSKFVKSNQSSDNFDNASEPRRARPRLEKSSDKKSSEIPRRERSFDKPFEKRGDKPAFKKPFDKPFEKRGERSFDKPFEKRGERNFDKPFEKRGERSFDKPFEKRAERSFDKPFEKRGERSFDKPAFKKPFEKREERGERSFDKPFEKRGERSFDKPFEKRGDKPAFKKPFEKREERGERSFDKPFEKRGERSFDKPFEKRGERSFDKPFEKRGERSFDKPFEKRGRASEEGDKPEKRSRAEDGLRRRVGEYTEAPRYDLRKAEEKYIKKDAPAPKDDLIRLNKYIANAGLCSRREADGLIETGQITVNGKVINELGHKVNPGDIVKYGNRILNPEKMVYILVNKPKDYITTTDDPEGRHTVMELISGACQERVYPVGRLDRNTTGLLLLTNDGELAEKLMHPSNEINKIYQVELDKPITTEDFEKIKEGLELEDGFIKPDDLALVTPDAMVVGIEIHSGRNRIVRRVFESLGYEVIKLDRTVYAGLNKKDLPRGKWRFLNEKEVVRLKYLV
ncbi:pseudouridine synthase [Runella sp. SP2]|uniref:pseudouridine synthase n=1 Tax=Runella sp. SP2 TaxID=2268026 RepID=UPI000F08BC92|nr:pseudouridine synthase [Runella sp. SP2]AYQ33695.1 pseudouridine synthase [Runella sp. SP2]